MNKNKFIVASRRAQKLSLPCNSLLEDEYLPTAHMAAQNQNASSSSDPRCVPANRKRTLSAVEPSVPTSSSSAIVAQRKDVPIVKYAKRANLSKVAEMLSSDTNKRLAVDQLEKETCAASSFAARNILLGTWLEFHRSFYGAQGPEPLPLTVESLRDVSAVFKSGNYRSYPNYLSRIKAEHIERGFDWTQQLDVAARKYKRSVMRGLGPARQSSEFNLALINELSLDEHPLCEGGPVTPVQFAIVNALFVVREIESAAALRSHIHLDITNLTVSWRLPMTKTDCSAVGKERRWGCLCDDQLDICPYHYFVKLFEVTSSMFGDDVSAIGFPLFPTACGSVCSKEAVAKTYESLALLTGEQIVDSDGDRKFGGRSARVTGSKYLARIGLDVLTIQVFARWGSNIILRYIQEAPLDAMTARTKAFTSFSKLRGVLQQDAMPSEVRAVLTNNKTNALELVQAQIDSIRLQLKVVQTHNINFVVNVDSNTIHLPVELIDSHIFKWRTKCGWKFARSTFSRTHAELPTGHKCPTCFKIARNKDGSSSDSYSHSDSDE
ncbi:unnamed protein product [Polarella glacialis]|uniref:Uncharacterized protein n=1 Tax=Polarella glacialis TaxID=89957 RepID=A0A813KZ82_POLGL|nr:unnamed protein product [Polarella glacialis]